MNTTKLMRHIVLGALTSGAIAANECGWGWPAGSVAAEQPVGTWCPGQEVTVRAVGAVRLDPMSATNTGT